MNAHAIVIRVIIAIIAFLLYLVPAIRWKKLHDGAYIDDAVVEKRRLYKNYSLFGMVMFVAAVLSIRYGMDDSAGNAVEEIVIYFAIGLFLGDLRVIMEPYYNSSIIPEVKELCLYLRPFVVDVNPKERSHISKNRSIEEVLCKELNERIAQTFAIGNPSSSLPATLSSTNIYAKDNEWRGCVETLSEKAYCVVVRVGESDGCRWELEWVISHHLLEKTIFIVDTQRNGFQVINQIFGRYGMIIDNQIDPSKPFSFLFFNYQNNNWVTGGLGTKKEVKELVRVFLDYHHEIAIKIEEYQREKNDTKIGISAWFWQALSIFLNPFVYCRINKWPILKRVVYNVTIFACIFSWGLIISRSRYNSIGLLPYVLLTFFTMALVIYGVRESYRRVSWGSYGLFIKTNRVCAIWLIVFMVMLKLLS